MLISGATEMRLTVVVSGAEIYEVSCPELRISYYSENIDTARKGLYRNLSQKAKALVNRNGTCPSPDLVPYAKLFLNNQHEVRKAIEQGREILAIGSGK